MPPGGFHLLKMTIWENWLRLARVSSWPVRSPSQNSRYRKKWSIPHCRDAEGSLRMLENSSLTLNSVKPRESKKGLRRVRFSLRAIFALPGRVKMPKPEESASHHSALPGNWKKLNLLRRVLRTIKILNFFIFEVICSTKIRIFPTCPGRYRSRK